MGKEKEGENVRKGGRRKTAERSEERRKKGLDRRVYGGGGENVKV